MDIRREFLMRMQNAACQFKRELQAAGEADGVVESVTTKATETGVAITFFEPALAKPKGKRAQNAALADPVALVQTEDSSGNSQVEPKGSAHDQPFTHG